MKINKMRRDITIRLYDENGREVDSEQYTMNDSEFSRRMNIFNKKSSDIMRDFSLQAETNFRMKNYKIEVEVRKD